MNEFSSGNMLKLIETNKDDLECLDLIFQCIKSFEDYHNAICEMEMKMKIYSGKSVGMDAYQDMISSLDRARTVNHNAVLANVNILNRIADKSGVGPVYSGVVSEDKPYRREVANAVLAYVEGVVRERV